MYGIAWPSKSNVLASRRASSGHAADLGEHLNLERGDAEAIRIAFGREVARRNRMCAKGRPEGFECGEYALGIGARRSDEYVHVVSGANVAVKDYCPTTH